MFCIFDIIKQRQFRRIVDMLSKSQLKEHCKHGFGRLGEKYGNVISYTKTDDYEKNSIFSKEDREREREGEIGERENERERREKREKMRAGERERERERGGRRGAAWGRGGEVSRTVHNALV